VASRSLPFLCRTAATAARSMEEAEEAEEHAEADTLGSTLSQ
jgi:hypothetical protein